jgi:hypothetical protein
VPVEALHVTRRIESASVHYRDTDIRDVGHNMNIGIVTQLTGRWVCRP